MLKLSEHLAVVGPATKLSRSCLSAFHREILFLLYVLCRSAEHWRSLLLWFLCLLLTAKLLFPLNTLPTSLYFSAWRIISFLHHDDTSTGLILLQLILSEAIHLVPQDVTNVSNFPT